MDVIVILILSSLGLAGFFLGAFVWATKSGQFEDTCTPSMRILTDEPVAPDQLPPPPRPDQPS